MEKIALGKTGIMATKISFGVLPIQRTEKTEAVRILRRAYEAGINYFDTARSYSDSEEKLGAALSDVREKVYIATKSNKPNAAEMEKDLMESLKNLGTDYIDVYQHHNPGFVSRPGSEDGVYDFMLKMKEKGVIRHIGITNHSLVRAREIVESGLYETLQYPFSYISDAQEFDLVKSCSEKGMGFVAMKAMCGGLLDKAAAVFYHFEQNPSALPIYGIQHMHELEEYLTFIENPPKEEDVLEIIAKDREELAGNFCRSCNYCAGCPAEIPIFNAGRMAFLLRRSPPAQYYSDEWYERMHRIENCTKCGHCVAHCPYGLDMPNILPAMLRDYEEFYTAHKEGRPAPTGPFRV